MKKENKYKLEKVKKVKHFPIPIFDKVKKHVIGTLYVKFCIPENTEVECDSSGKITLIEVSSHKKQREEPPMTENTCKTCIDNDCGLCDRIGRLVEDDDTCDKWRGESWQEAMMRTFLAGH